MNTMHIEDFIVLGRTVPEESKKYGKKICMAGYSEKNNQLLRVYPLMFPTGSNAATNRFRARFRYTVDLQRNDNDSRSESWRVNDERNPTSTPWEDAKEVSKNDVLDWLMKRRVETVQCLNDCKLSLGVMLLKAGEWEGVMVPREKKEQPLEHASLFDDLEDQASLDDKAKFDPNNVKYAPYIHFKDPAGNHRLQVREWGAFILLANPTYSDKPEALWDANAYKKDRDTVIVIGNMLNHRNNWLIIKTFQPDLVVQTPSLFSDIGDDE